ncbi:OmpA family protein [Belliella sp. R4-6]|uniref:OmpA family protein n=1 Tax=Belliella alkalica TaxID=1730871 RepID=A0ABS9V6S1_9BACT|nr:OmpA family protein [Belliella alkalica]MCH7412115.1 OmpA family protein [Belliella alkalica]
MKIIKTIITVYISLILVGFVSAQGFQTFEKRRLQEANDAFKKGQFLEALDLYKKSLSVKETREAVQGLAMTNYYLKNYEVASEGFLYLKDNFELSEDDVLPYFETSVKLKDYKQAQLLYQLSKFSNRINLKKNELAYMQGILKKNENPIIDQSVESIVSLSGINSIYRDFGLQNYNGTYYFVSNKPDKFFQSTGNPYENLIFKSYQINSSDIESTQNAQLVTFIENKVQHGIITFSNHFVFYSASELDNTKKLKNIILPDNDIRLPEIFLRPKLENGQYGAEQKLINDKSEKYAMIDPHWDFERNILIFSSDIPGGYGGLDLYYVEYLGKNKWSKPKNIGKPINTDKDERSPFVKDAKLYFSSNGHEGYGGYDVYFSIIKANSYGQPENLEMPTNSNGDDLFFTIYKNQDQKEAYISSNRDGNDDLYKITYVNNSTKSLGGIVFDREYNTPIKPLKILYLQDLDTTLIYTDDKGKFEINWNPEVQKSSVLILNKGYEPFQQIIIEPAKSKEYMKFGMTRLNTEKQLLFEAGFDDSGKLTKGDNTEKLDRLVLLLKHNMDTEVQIFCHTDARGNPITNKRKSETRAQLVKDYLTNQGINKDRIKTIGEGSGKPINDCVPGIPCSDEEHLENDRVEFQIINNKK